MGEFVWDDKRNTKLREIYVFNHAVISKWKVIEQEKQKHKIG